MKRYLHLISFDDAIALARRTFPVPARTETVTLPDALERILAEPVYAGYAVPEANLSAMDGIAVRSADTLAAGEQNPVVLPFAARVNTGNIVPTEYDAVIMIEEVWEDSGRFTIRKPAFRSQNVRSAGEDIRRNEMILPAGHHIRPLDIGALASYGFANLKVRALSVGIIPTGGELVPLGTRPAPGQVVDSNSMMIASFLSEFGVSCTRFPITPDDPVLIGKTIRAAVRNHDLVLVSAGSSAGTKDFTEEVIR